MTNAPRNIGAVLSARLAYISGLAGAKRDARLKVIQIALTAWLCFFMIRCIAASMRWPMVHDGAIMSYLALLIDHGMAPYRDIVEMSLPGTYILFGLGRHIFGTSDFAFRLFDLFALITACGAMMAIGWSRGRWFSGILGSALLLLAHTGSVRGIIDLGQRDFFMACLLICAVTCMLEAVRRRMPSLMLGYGMCVAAAMSIKPTAVFFLLPLVLACIHLRRSDERIGRYLIYSTAGMIFPAAIVLCILLREHSLPAFFHMLPRLDALYARLGDMPYLEMLMSLVVVNWFVVPLILVAALRREVRFTWDAQMLFVCALLGAASYFVQHKGFPYHTYPLLVFGYFWLAFVITGHLHDKQRYHYVALSALLISAAAYPWLIRSPEYREDYVHLLQEDLRSSAVGVCAGEVQCLDTTDGCINALYRMNIVQSTGFVGDFPFFLSEKHPIVRDLRASFLKKIEEHKTKLIILSDQQWPGEERGYEQLESWPALSLYLQANYHLMAQREAMAGWRQAGYRLYVRNDDRLLHAAPSSIATIGSGPTGH